MRAVNLLPRQQVTRERERPGTVVLVASIGGAAVLLALVAGFLVANRSVDRQRQALASARAMLAATPAHRVSAQTQAFRSTVLSDREQRSLALAAAIGKRVAWDRILRRFALVLPSDVWLTSVTGNVPLDPASSTAVTTTPSVLPAAATELTIQGYTYSQDSVARLLERLQVVPDLKNVQLQSSTWTQLGGHAVYAFTIVSDIRQGKGAS
ncbi:MAG TPA: PilN domain-containing protein [Gaiellaceae bacterium]|nr:PilN domain-containing protein [Gaiellaceae bacterium]